jgi:hypothetical protein
MEEPPGRFIEPKMLLPPGASATWKLLFKTSLFQKSIVPIYKISNLHQDFQQSHEYFHQGCYRQERLLNLFMGTFKSQLFP